MRHDTKDVYTILAICLCLIGLVTHTIFALTEGENTLFHFIFKPIIGEVSMFGKLVTSKVRMDLEELRHKHKLETEALREQFTTEKRRFEEDKKRHIKQLTEDHEIKLREAVSLSRLHSEQLVKQAELRAQELLNAKIAQLNSDHYDKLSESMTKLHEEGNANTRFTKELALSIFKGMPEHKTTTKVITHGEEQEKGG